MWSKIAGTILRNRSAFIVGILLITMAMGYFATKIQLSYEFARVLPKTDAAYLDYTRFKEIFGEDGNVLVVGYADPNVFDLEQYRSWYNLTNEIKAIPGIREVLSIANLYDLKRNDSLSKFDLVPLIKGPPETQGSLDSLKARILKLPFYEDLVYNKETGATVLAITFEKKELNSKKRISIVEEIKKKGEQFGTRHGLDVHFSGMPFIRTEYMRKIASEMQLFLFLAVLVTAFILWIFFRSFTSVIIAMVIVTIGVIWSLGTIYLFGYKITVLSGLIPPLIIVIGVPNCIFFINKYHNELKQHGNKIKALTRMVEKVGLSLFLANITTAIGFGVFYFTNSSLLMEFGVIAALNVMCTYLISLIFTPIIFSYLPAPSLKHTKHLSARGLVGILKWVDFVVHNHRKKVYLIITCLTLISFYGMSRITILGYVVDDLPVKDPVYKDLRFFEHNFKGILPFEIFIDTKKPNGVFANNAATLYKMKRLQRILEDYEFLSKPISVVEGIKFSYQALKGGEKKYFILPPATELNKLSEFSTNGKVKEERFKAFLDSTKQITRVSVQMADIGSKKMKEVINEIRPRIDSIFDPAEYNVKITGHSVMFLKSNDYLLKNLIESLVIAILLIFMVGLILFRSIPIIVLSKLPCLIPLVMTAGIMGFFDIYFKPSTILIFSIAFGIASDGTIYFLTRYRQELRNMNTSISEAVSITIRETGISMIYTAIILLFGFSIFAASSFGGTVALGLLISITLLVAMCTNLILLPAMLLSLERRLVNKAFMKEPMLQILDEEEDIEIEKLEIRKTEETI